MKFVACDLEEVPDENEPIAKRTKNQLKSKKKKAASKKAENDVLDRISSGQDPSSDDSCGA